MFEIRIYREIPVIISGFIFVQKAFGGGLLFGEGGLLLEFYGMGTFRPSQWGSHSKDISAAPCWLDNSLGYIAGIPGS